MHTAHPAAHFCLGLYEIRGELDGISVSEADAAVPNACPGIVYILQHDTSAADGEWSLVAFDNSKAG
jgi:hypothetical protein